MLDSSDLKILLFELIYGVGYGKLLRLGLGVAEEASKVSRFGSLDTGLV